MILFVLMIKLMSSMSQSELVKYLAQCLFIVMCKRLINACPVCKKWEGNLSVCKEYNKDKFPNMFSSGWFYEHAKRNVRNVRNAIKFVFCDKCREMNKILVQPDCDKHYQKEMESCAAMIRLSYVGTIEIRNRMSIRNQISMGRIFLD